VKLYVITTRTKDYGDKYVLRAHTVTPSGSFPEAIPIAVVDTIEEAREHVPFGCMNLGRDEQDDPVIVETWL